MRFSDIYSPAELKYYKQHGYIYKDDLTDEDWRSPAEIDWRLRSNKAYDVAQHFCPDLGQSARWNRVYDVVMTLSLHDLRRFDCLTARDQATYIFNHIERGQVYHG